ncbi:hypothetical protein HPP92_000849 [Vanilla planifolia]|uniref:Cysteine-rich PDZ-binding protein n=1 Tax=Vanilla planifolia TaxID=51239 RepID=A0A835S278_VANPL|nr:hypothetical protein HPP92_000849 [Vanilla planifolia]
MVCEKCEKKLSKVIVPDKWKEGASNTTEGGGRKINENKLLSKKQSNMLETAQGIAHEIALNIALGKSDGHHMETLNALSVNNKFTKMPNTATLVLIPKAYHTDELRQSHIKITFKSLSQCVREKERGQTSGYERFNGIK